MTSNNGNGKITIAKIGQQLEDFKEYTEKCLQRMERNEEKRDNKIDSILYKLTKGDGKIRKNIEEIEAHKKYHDEKDRSILAQHEALFKKSTIIISVIGVIIALLSFILGHI